MNHPGIKLITFIVALLLFGCNSANQKSASVNKQSNQAILQDSLHKLDSLVLRSRIKNADESVKYARLTLKVAHELNTPESQVKAYMAMGNAYAAARIDSGVYYYNKARVVADSFNLTAVKAKVLYNLGMLNRFAGNSRNYLLLIDSARRYAVMVNDFVTISNSLNALGSFYHSIGANENARKLFDSAYAIANRNSLSLQVGAALGNLARFEPDDKKSVQLQRHAISYLEKSAGSEEQIALCLINVGYRCQNVDSSIFYYHKAISMVSAEFAPEVVIGAYNNMAYCYLQKGDFQNAGKCILDHALPISLKSNNIDWQSTVCDTYSDVLKRQGRSAESMVYKNKSVEARKYYRNMSNLMKTQIKPL